MSQTLTQYEVALADLLHDPSNLTWSTTQLDRYINEARRRVTKDTGWNRVLQTLVTTQGVEGYTFGQVSGALVTAGGTGYTAPGVSFSGGGGTGVAATLGSSGGAVTSISFTNNGSGYTSVPGYSISGGGSGATLLIGALSVNTYDVLDVYIYWGSARYPLRWREWSKYSMLMRQWTTLQTTPRMWAKYGETQIYVGPLSDQSYQCDVDSLAFPADLSGGATVDTMPIVYQDLVKYYAAYIAKNNQQMYGEAEKFKQQYTTELMDSIGSYVRRISDPYQQGASR